MFIEDLCRFIDFCRFCMNLPALCCFLHIFMHMYNYLSIFMPIYAPMRLIFATSGPKG